MTIQLPGSEVRRRNQLFCMVLAGSQFICGTDQHLNRALRLRIPFSGNPSDPMLGFLVFLLALEHCHLRPVC